MDGLKTSLVGNKHETTAMTGIQKICSVTIAQANQSRTVMKILILNSLGAGQELKGKW